MTRESKKEEHSEPEEPVIRKPTEEPPPETDSQESGKVINKEEKEKEKTGVLDKIPRPPGEPVLTVQIGGQEKKKKGKNKSDFWRAKWTSH